MKSYIVMVWLLSVSHAQLQNSVEDCTVFEQKSGELKPCEDVFVYENQTYYGCTTEDSENGEAWCSTKVDPRTYEHINGTGFFGYCRKNKCIMAEKGKKEQDRMMALQEASFAKLSKREMNDTLSTCNCQSWDTCEWSNEIVNGMSTLPANSEAFKSNEAFFKKMVCDGKSKKVYCCNRKAPTMSQMKMLATRSGLPSAEELRTSSGTWKPDGFKGECGTRTLLINIVGGKVAQLGEHPYMAQLGYSDGSLSCGGSLINKRYVLTAAHCIDQYDEFGDKKDLTEIVLGEHTVGENPDCNKKGTICAPKTTRMNITSRDQIIVHDDFSAKTGINDIALIRLNELVTLFSEDPTESFITPVCLPWADNDPGRGISNGNKTVITGWGRTQNPSIDNESDVVFSTKLQKVPVAISNDKCQLGDKFEVDPQIQLCAGGEKGKDSCGGDSGGPLVFREFAGEPWYEVGLVSYGTRTCGIGIPAVYTKVASFLSWIEEKMQP